MSTRAGFLSLLIFGSAVGACSAQTAGRPAVAIPKKVTIGYVATPGAEAVTRQLRWVDDGMGVPIIWVKNASGREAVEGIREGKLDIAMGDSVAVAQGIATRAPFLVVWIYGIHAGDRALVTPGGKNLRMVSELAGKMVYVPFLSAEHYMLTKILEANGMGASSVRLTDMAPADIVTAWKAGTPDAAFVSDRELNVLSSGGGRRLATARALVEKGQAVADLCMAANKFAAAYPAFLSRYIEIQNRGAELCRDNPDGAAPALMSAIGMTQFGATNALGAVVFLTAKEQIEPLYFGRTKKRGALGKSLKNIADFLVEQKALPAAPPLSDFEAAANPTGVERLLAPPSEGE